MELASLIISAAGVIIGSLQLWTDLRPRFEKRAAERRGLRGSRQGGLRRARRPIESGRQHELAPAMTLVALLVWLTYFVIAISTGTFEDQGDDEWRDNLFLAALVTSCLAWGAHERRSLIDIAKFSAVRLLTIFLFSVPYWTVVYVVLILSDGPALDDNVAATRWLVFAAAALSTWWFSAYRDGRTGRSGRT